MFDYDVDIGESGRRVGVELSRQRAAPGHLDDQRSDPVTLAPDRASRPPGRRRLFTVTDVVIA
jgi:hypothetical protein